MKNNFFKIFFNIFLNKKILLTVIIIVTTNPKHTRNNLSKPSIAAKLGGGMEFCRKIMNTLVMERFDKYLET